MESLTHESDDSSSCTQSDSTNSSNGGNPFILRPRPGSSVHLELSRGSHPLDTVEDANLSCTMPPHDQHRATIANLQGAGPTQYLRNGAHTWICDSDGLPSSTLHSHSRFYPPSVHEECTIPMKQSAAAAGVHHGSLAYLGPTQSFYTPEQWTDVRQQAYMLKHVARHDTPASALLLPMRCKIQDVKAGSFLLGLADGRCRRTDGKKWRCGRAVVPNQKYCERHMHRGRGRSKAARLAKVNTSINDQPLNVSRPLNKPLIHLLNQLAVPVQPLNPAPNSIQPVNQFPIPAQPLNWLPKLPFAYIEPDSQTPMVAQPLNDSVNQAKLLDQPTISTNPSRSLDWSFNHSPFQAELLNSGHAHNVVQHDTTLATRSDYKATNGSFICDTSRRRTDDPDDVLTLDVEGIKRLLENAPCNNKRRRLSTGQPPNECPNPADLLDVAHAGHLSAQPNQPPSLVDVLRMVEPPTSINTQFNSQQLQIAAMNSGKEAKARPHTGSQLPLQLLDRKQSKNSSTFIATLANSPNMSTTPIKEGAKLLTLFKVKCEEHEVAEDGDITRHTEAPTTSASSSRTLDAPAYSVEVSQGRSGINRHSPTLMEEMGHHIPGLVDESSSPHSHTARLDMNVCSSVEVRWEHSGSSTKRKGDSPALVAERLKLDVNVSALVDERWEHAGSDTTLKGNSLTTVAEVLNHHISHSKSKRETLKKIESLDDHEASEMAKENISKLGKQSLDHHSAKPEENCPKLIDESSDHHESSAKLEIDLSIDMDPEASGEVDKGSPDSAKRRVKHHPSFSDSSMAGTSHE